MDNESPYNYYLELIFESYLVIGSYCASYSGNPMFLMNEFVAWNTHKHHVVDVSSREAKCIDVSDTCKDGLCLYCLLGVFVKVLKSITIYSDNQAAMSMASNRVRNKRSKHFGPLYPMIRDDIFKGMFSLDYVSTDTNIADVMTKVLDMVKHKKFPRLLM